MSPEMDVPASDVSDRAADAAADDDDDRRGAIEAAPEAGGGGGDDRSPRPSREASPDDVVPRASSAGGRRGSAGGGKSPRKMRRGRRRKGGRYGELAGSETSLDGGGEASSPAVAVDLSGPEEEPFGDVPEPEPPASSPPPPSSTSPSNDAEGDPPFRSFLVVLLFQLIRVTGFSIVIPTSKRYTESFGPDVPSRLGGVLVGLDPLLSATSQIFVLKPLLDRVHFRCIVVGYCSVQIAAWICYAIAPSISSYGLALFSRSLMGVASGPLSVHYVARATSPSHRSRYMMIVSTTVGFGYFVGPAIGLILERMCSRLDWADEDAAPGWTMATAFGGLACASAAFLVEPPAAAGRTEEEEEDATFPDEGRGAVKLTERGEGEPTRPAENDVDGGAGWDGPGNIIDLENDAGNGADIVISAMGAEKTSEGARMRRHPALPIADVRDFDDDLRDAPQTSDVERYNPVPSPFRSVATERGRAEGPGEAGDPPPVAASISFQSAASSSHGLHVIRQHGPFRRVVERVCPFEPGVASCYLLLCVLTVNLGAWEVVTVYRGTSSEGWNWTVEFAAGYLATFNLLATGLSVAAQRFPPHFRCDVDFDANDDERGGGGGREDRIGIARSFACMLLSSPFFFDYATVIGSVATESTLYGIGALLLLVGTNFGRGYLFGLVSKIPTTARRKRLAMSYNGVFYMLGRATGAILAPRVADGRAHGTFVAGTNGAALLALSLGLYDVLVMEPDDDDPPEMDGPTLV